MIKRTIFLLAGFLFVLFLAKSVSAVSLEDCENGSKDSACIDLLQKKIGDLGTQKKTLSGQIAQFNSQIQVTQLKIADAQATVDKLEKEIGALGARIGYINQSVDRLGVLLKQRIVATYQQSFVSNLELVLTSSDFSDLVLRLQYLKQVQENDKKLLTSLQETKSNYANQKDERVQKQAAIEESKRELEALKVDFDNQKIQKQQFLEATKNDEARYQRLLAQAQAEIAITFGGGSETYIRDVNQGESIGSIASYSVSPGCSTGAHLHFEVHKGGGVDNPGNYLKSGGYAYPEGYDQSYYGSVNPSGDLPWPLNETVIIYQGYGSHPFAKAFYSNGTHQGIDMDSGSKTVKAVKSGKLYGGSYSCSNGSLYYAKIDHGDGLTTWYLHMVPS
jgi:peptidoglycan hydrolase CwlO-like protein